MSKLDWNSADTPPDGQKGKWSRRVVVVTDHENSFSCSYFHGEEFGCWQSPKALQHGEKIILWTELPEVE